MNNICYVTGQTVVLSDGTPVQIINFAHYKGKVRRRFPYHSHSHYEISFTFHGQNNLMINGVPYLFGSHDICLAAPEVIHAITLPQTEKHEMLLNEADDVWEIDVILPENDFTRSHAGLAQIGEMAEYEEFFRASLYLILSRLQNHGRMGSSELSLLSVILEYVFEIFSGRERLSIRDQTDSFIREIYLYINENFNRGITLEQLLEKFPISSSHLNRMFRKNFGIAPISYRIDLQLSAAAELLVKQEMTNAETAEAVGFEDANYFSNFFTRQMNLPPQQYGRKYYLKRVEGTKK